MITQEDHTRITAAVAQAEEGSSGDIFCVLAGEVSSYREVPIAWGAAAALLIPPVVLALGGLREVLSYVTEGGWTVGQVGALRIELALALSAYAIAQVIIFGVVALLTSLGPVRRAVTPGFLKRHRVRKAAFHHFAAAHAHARESETGILIFIALVERRVEVLADAAIHAKAGEAVWNEVADAVRKGMKRPDPTDGIVEAIGICGKVLKQHFPSTLVRVADKPVDD